MQVFSNGNTNAKHILDSTHFLIVWSTQVQYAVNSADCTGVLQAWARVFIHQAQLLASVTDTA